MEFAMPGSFHPDYEKPTCPKLTRTTASSTFVPPFTPSAASFLSKSIHALPRDFSGSENDLRKRPRSSAANGWCTSGDVHSPSPLVDTRYRLAGGHDGLQAQSVQEYYEDEGEEQDYRPNQFSATFAREYQPNDYFPRTPALHELGPERKPRRNSYQHSKTWGRVVLSLTGKVFNFCSIALRGFYAGGGEGYSMQTSNMAGSQSHPTDLTERDDVFNNEYRPPTPLPGEFPQESFIEDYMMHPREDVPTPCQMNEERSTELCNNWVMVYDRDLVSREASPGRMRTRTARPSLDIRRPTLRSTMHTRPGLAPLRPSTSNASFASSRSQSHQRPSTSEGSSRPTHQRSRSSFASPRQVPGQGEFENTPISPEVKKFKKKVKKQEKMRGESLRRLTAQTADLIREGREALGTRFEVQDGSDLEDEGYEEGEKLEHWPVSR